MERYKIYCTPEQTKKALELGAPIEIDTAIAGDYDFDYDNKVHVSKHLAKTAAYQDYATIPTAEQMCGWLRSQGFRFRIKDLEESTHWEVTMDAWFADGELSTPKEAILAAIDAALEYYGTSNELR